MGQRTLPHPRHRLNLLRQHRDSVYLADLGSHDPVSVSQRVVPGFLVDPARRVDRETYSNLVSVPVKHDRKLSVQVFARDGFAEGLLVPKLAVQHLQNPRRTVHAFGFRLGFNGVSKGISFQRTVLPRCLPGRKGLSVRHGPGIKLTTKLLKRQPPRALTGTEHVLRVISAANQQNFD